MTRNDLYDILHECNGDNIASLERIWGQPFDGETERIKPVTEQSSATLSESFPDGTTYTDRRDSETPNQPQ
jgi:hypothetical protein